MKTIIKFCFFMFVFNSCNQSGIINHDSKINYDVYEKEKKYFRNFIFDNNSCFYAHNYIYVHRIVKDNFDLILYIKAKEISSSKDEFIYNDTSIIKKIMIRRFLSKETLNHQFPFGLCSDLVPISNGRNDMIDTLVDININYFKFKYFLQDSFFKPEIEIELTGKSSNGKSNSLSFLRINE